MIDRIVPLLVALALTGCGSGSDKPSGPEAADRRWRDYPCLCRFGAAGGGG